MRDGEGKMPGKDSLEFTAALALGGLLGAGAALLLRREMASAHRGSGGRMPGGMMRKKENGGWLRRSDGRVKGE